MKEFFACNYISKHWSRYTATTWLVEKKETEMSRNVQIVWENGVWERERERQKTDLNENESHLPPWLVVWLVWLLSRLGFLNICKIVVVALNLMKENTKCAPNKYTRYGAYFRIVKWKSTSKLLAYPLNRAKLKTACTLYNI